MAGKMSKNIARMDGSFVRKTSELVECSKCCTIN